MLNTLNIFTEPNKDLFIYDCLKSIAEHTAGCSVSSNFSLGFPSQAGQIISNCTKMGELHEAISPQRSWTEKELHENGCTASCPREMFELMEPFRRDFPYDEFALNFLENGIDGNW